MNNKKKVLLAHGSGGRLMHELITEVFKKKFSNEILNESADAAVIKTLPNNKYHLCFTTDSYVVNPLFFPRADIGKLAICGSINDLAVMGAKPLFISCGFIIEEGLDYEILEKIAESMANTAKRNSVKIVTGDIKVVEKNSADKLFINTSSIGIRDKNFNLSPKVVTPKDKIIINGSLGEHELAILAARGDFDFQTEIESDCASLSDLIEQVLKEVPDGVKFMRDPTRGGLATTLNEMVEKACFGVLIYEEALPVKEQVRAACEILGFEPLYMANEGKVVIISDASCAQNILEVMRQNPLGRDSRIIGEVIDNPKEKVIMKTVTGGSRIVDMLSGEQLPRIC